MKKKYYTKEELVLGPDTPDEDKRTRAIFEELKKRAKKEERMTELEKNFFCMGVKFSIREDGRMEQYSCCDNFRFKILYLTYFRDFTGGTRYVKAKKGKVVEVGTIEAQHDLQYLEEVAGQWEGMIKKTNHSDQLLQQAAQEGRFELKNLSEQPEIQNTPFIRGSFYFRYKVMNIVLHNKFLFCMALEIFETLDPADFVMSLNEETIEFNEYTLIHILNRHFSAIVKQYPTGKTFHSEDFTPRLLSRELKEIVETIDASGLLRDKQINHVVITYKGQLQSMWTSIETKSVKGKGNIPYRRLNTFYPLKDEKEWSDVTSCRDLVQIDENLSVYVPR